MHIIIALLQILKLVRLVRKNTSFIKEQCNTCLTQNGKKFPSPLKWSAGEGTKFYKKLYKHA
jgi:hypothetical protein